MAKIPQVCMGEKDNSQTCFWEIKLDFAQHIEPSQVKDLFSYDVKSKESSE